MFPTAPIRTAPDTASLMQGGVSTSFATVTKTATTTATSTATDTIVKTAYTTSTVTVSAAAKYTTTHLRAIVPLSLLKNVTAAYNIVDKQNAATETYAIKWALGAALTTGAALAWHIRKTPPPPVPPGVDRLRWKAIRHHVHNWLHEKLRSDAALSKELEDAKKKLEEYEVLREARTDHPSQTEKLSEGVRSVQNGTLQQMIDFNRMRDEATPLHEELRVQKEKAVELQQALKVEKDSATKLQHQLQKTTEELGRSIVRVREARRHTVESGVHRKESGDTGATVASLREQLDAALQEASKAKAEAASKEKQLQVSFLCLRYFSKETTSLDKRLRDANRSAFDVESDLASMDQELQVARNEQNQANSVLAYIVTQRQVAEQEASQSKTKLASKEAELQAAQAEIKRVNCEATSLNTELKEAQQEAKEANAKVFSMQKRLDKAKQEMNDARIGMTEMEKLMPAVYAEMDSLNSQLNKSRQEEEKARTDISSLEREPHTARLEHSKRVASLEEQLRNSRQEVGEKDPLTAKEREVNDNLQTALNDENEYLKGQLRNEAANRKKLETEVKKLDSEAKDLKERFQNEAANCDALEMEVEKLKLEIDTAKAKDVATPPLKSLTSSETQTLPITISSQGSPSFQSDQTPHSPPQLLSIAGGTISSIPRPGDLQVTPTTPATTSTPEADYTPEHIALTKSWNAREIELPAYLEGMLALTTSTKPLKRKPGEFEVTPRPIKKLRPSEESADRPIANVLTPGGGPAFKLPKQGSVSRADDGIALDGSESPKLLNAENSKASTAGPNDANLSVLPEQDAAKAGIDSLGSIPTNDGDHSMEHLGLWSQLIRSRRLLVTITDNTATKLPLTAKRKISFDDDEGSPRPFQVPRTKENLGGEQTLGLDELTPKLVTNAAHPFANASSPGGGPGARVQVQGIFPLKDDGMVFDANETAELNDSNPSVVSNQVAMKAETESFGNILGRYSDLSKEDAATVRNKDSPPEAEPASIESAEPNGDTTIADSNEVEIASTTRVTKHALAQARRRKSRLPAAVPLAGFRKSVRNAGRLAVSLNERDLSRRSASLQKSDKAPTVSSIKPPVKPSAKPRASRSPSKAKNTK